MAGPWTFFTLVGFLVLMQLCNSHHSDGSGVRTAELPKKWNEENPVPILNKILLNLRRINDIFTFKILDEETRRTNLENQIAQTSRRRKCKLQTLLFGLPCKFTNDSIRRPERPLRPKPENVDKEEDSRLNIFSQRKRRPYSNVDSNINDDSHTNNNRFSSINLLQSLFKRRGASTRNPEDDTDNTNSNGNLNYNDETLDVETNALNDDDGLSALNDDDDGPGALNDETDDSAGFNDDTDGFNDEVDGPNLNDETGVLNDDFDETGVLKDEFDGFAALNDEDGGPGALNDKY